MIKITKNILAALVALAVVPMTASATLMVNFDASTTADTDGVGYLTAPDNVPFSDTVARSPGIGANGYGDAPDTSAIFYGGADHSGSGGINDVPYLESSDNSWRYRLGPVAIGDRMGALMLWKKVDFLNGGNAAAVSMDATSSFTVNTDTFGSGFVNKEVRFVVQEGGSYYISDSVSSAIDSDVDSTLSNPESASWFAYDPATDMLAQGASATLAFIDITAVGVYVEFGSTAAGNQTLAINNFQVDAIPEPATIGLISVFSGAILFIRRRFMI
jgi:hypothetical protein